MRIAGAGSRAGVSGGREAARAVDVLCGCGGGGRASRGEGRAGPGAEPGSGSAPEPARPEWSSAAGSQRVPLGSR